MAASLLSTQGFGALCLTDVMERDLIFSLDTIKKRFSTAAPCYSRCPILLQISWQIVRRSRRQLPRSFACTCVQKPDTHSDRHPFNRIPQNLTRESRQSPRLDSSIITEALLLPGVSLYEHAERIKLNLLWENGPCHLPHEEDAVPRKS